MARISHFAGCTIRKVSKTNPYRKGSNRAKRYDRYRNGMSFESAREAKITASGMMQDVRKGVIEFYEHA